MRKFIKKLLERKITRRKIFEEIEQFVLWKEEKFPSIAHSQKEYLIKFAEWGKFNDVTQVTTKHTCDFIRDMKYNGYHQVFETEKALRCFVRYYKTMKYPLLIQNIMAICYDEDTTMAAPYTDMNKVGEVIELKEKGLSIQAIADKLHKDKKTVLRWYQCGIGKREVRTNAKLFPLKKVSDRVVIENLVFRKKPENYFLNTCNRCGHTWQGATDSPKTCANKKCKSPYWNKERVIHKLA